MPDKITTQSTNAVLPADVDSGQLSSKQKILDAASVLFLEKGMNGLTVRAISQKAGLSTIGIYSHFQGKQGILDALYIEGFNKVSDVITGIDDQLSAREATIQASRNYIQMAVVYKAHYRLIFGEVSSSYTPSDDAKRAGIRAFNSLTALIARNLPVSYTLIEKQRHAIELWAMIHGYISLSQHAVTQLVDIQDWQQEIVHALEGILDRMERM